MHLHKLLIVFSLCIMQHISAMEQEEEDQILLDMELWRAIFKENAARTQKLIEAGARVHQQYENKSSLIHAACSTDCLDIYRQLLEKHVALETRDINGDTALNCAIYYLREKVCELLVAHGANLFTRNDLNNTPLIFAARRQATFIRLANEMLGNNSEARIESERFNPKLLTICTCLINHQKACDKGIIEALLYFKKEIPVLYQIRSLLKPHLENYTLKSLINARDASNNCAYDYWQHDLLKP